MNTPASSSLVSPRLITLGLASGLASLGLLLAPVAGAATFVVNTPNDVVDWAGCDASHCSIVEAIQASESNSTADDIVFAAAYTVTLGTSGVYDGVDHIGLGDSALPVVTQTLTIDGAGSELTRATSGPDYRIIRGSTTSHLTLRDVTISNGVADGGGGIFSEGDLVLEDAVVENNTTMANWGGGINVSSYWSTGTASLILRGVSIRNNTSLAFGGGVAVYYHDGASINLTVEDSAITGNTAEYMGGGMFISHAVSTFIRDTTISNNTTNRSGGGIAFHLVPVTNNAHLRNVTVTDNHVADYAGGIYIYACGASGCSIPVEPTLVNTILAMNTNGGSAGSADCQGPFVSLGHNILGQYTDFSGICSGSGPLATGTDQVVLSLPFVGPLTATGAAGGERHRIYSGSAAHDMGDNGYCAVDDQIDVARFGATCEIGAVELEEHDSCCTATGCIEDISANECLAQHGDFRAGVGCNQMPFCSLPMEPSPVQVKKSSCCTPHGCLNNIAPAACEALNGTFRPGQACNQFPFCPVKQEPTKPGKFGKAGPGYGFTKQQTDTKTEYESDTAYQSKSVR